MATYEQLFKAGWIPDPIKDHPVFDQSKFSVPSLSSSNDIDLRPWTSPRRDQASLSCCVAESTTKALEIKHIIAHGMDNHYALSILDVYYNTRELMDPPQTDKDAGTYISLACQALFTIGVCGAEMWPFEESKVNIKPPFMATRQDRMNRITGQYKIVSNGQQRLDDIIWNLRAKNPVVFGTQIGKDWFNYKPENGPIGIESYPVGGHAICCCGFVGGNFIIENSWSCSWGDNGFIWLKPEVLMDSKTTDIWAMTTGSDGIAEVK